MIGTIASGHNGMAQCSFARLAVDPSDLSARVEETAEGFQTLVRTLFSSNVQRRCAVRSNRLDE